MMHRAATGQAAHTGGARPEPERPDLDHGGVGNRRPVSNSRIRLARWPRRLFRPVPLMRCGEPWHRREGEPI
jgi:hypothetical protein